MMELTLPVVLPRKLGRVRSDEVVTLDVVGGENGGSQLAIE